MEPSPNVTPNSWRTRTSPPTPQMSPYSVHQQTATEPDEVLSTTVLADNIHCGSCVKYIEDLLEGMGSDILSVSVSVVNHEAHVLHHSSISASDICSVLADGAFEVSSATTVDKYDSIKFEFRPDGAKEQRAEGWLQTLRPSNHARTSSYRLPFTPKSNRTRHIENCASCQENEKQYPYLERLEPIGLSGNQGGRESQTIKQSTKGPRTDNSDESGKLRLQKEQNHASSSQPGTTKGGERQADSQSFNNSMSQLHAINLSIGGMTCSSCTNAIKEGLEAMDAVKAVSVDLMSNSAKVEYSGKKDFADQIIETVEDLGYEASVGQTLEMPLNLGNKAPKASNRLYETSLSVGGMTCASCSNSITGALKELPFVKSIDVSLMNNSGTVVYEGEDHLPSILERIEDLGYECSADSTKAIEAERRNDMLQRAGTRTIQLKIDGMFCEHCPLRVRQALDAKFGSSLQIQKEPDLRSPLIALSYQPQLPKVSIRNIIECIDSLNHDFHASVYHPPSIEDRSRQIQLRERRKIFLRLVLSALVTIPTLLIGIIWMDLVSDDDPTRMYLEQVMWAGNVTRAEWALFFLATPIYFFAADVFHLRALKEIRALWRPGSKVPVLRRFYRFGSMNLLISAGTTVAYASSLALLIVNATSTSSGASTTYFDSVVFLTFFIMLGQFLEALGKSKAGNAVSMLAQLRPQQAMLVLPSDLTDKSDSDLEKAGSHETSQPLTKTQNVHADLLEVGDMVIIPHGSSPPADGILVSGEAQFDESSLTGESRPVKKTKDDKVFVGTINKGNPVRIEITELGGTSMLDQIIAVVREGQTRRAPVERLADLVTGYFVPVITTLAIITFFVWLALGLSGALDPEYLGNAAGGWAFWSLEFAIAVFVVACPCGIGLAAPTALFVGGGLAAKHGILVRGGGEAFQEASKIDAVVFDKTGTLTEGGDLKVTDHEMLFKDQSDGHMWSIVAALEESSSHPIARAIHEFASLKAKATPTTQTINEVPGRGLRGTFTFESSPSSPNSITYEAALGSEAFINSFSPQLLQHNTFATQTLSTWKSQAKSVAVLATRLLPSPPTSISTSASPTATTSPHLQPPEAPTWTLTALFSTSDALRPSALPTLRALQARNIPVYMLSGDNPETATAVGTSLGIPVSHIFAGVLPQQKAAKIEELQRTLAPRSRSKRSSILSKDSHASAQGSKPSAQGSDASIAFVGDGINDAPALLAASVSISPSTGSPIALTSASFILMSGSLESIIALLDLSRRVFRRIKFNFAWALVYNVCLVPVAAGVFFRVREGGWILGPVWAAAAMAASSVSVVLGSLMLRWEGKRG